MSRRATFVTSAPTTATAAAAFPGDEPLDGRGVVWAEAGRGHLPRSDRVCHGPERACGETCSILGLDGSVDPLLRDWDLASWSGRTLDDVAAKRPDDVAAWLADPDAAPHGGEALTALLARVQQWMAGLPSGHTLAVCAPAVVRAAVVTVLGAPAAAFWRIDLGPMTLTDIRGGGDRWTVRATAVPLGRAP
ncbi:histidine phosphatase family protein [Pseudonocardia sp. CA-142604]|uniref:histidine phosphatase family protein n=1 Tax=Pseudonocardia sp. CA-142604 TaxID=3240024 RepID=UPI003D8E508B